MRVCKEVFLWLRPAVRVIARNRAPRVQIEYDVEL